MTSANIGDIITLKLSQNCFLFADILENVYWNYDVIQFGANTPVSFERCLWRICKKLSYADQEMAVALRAQDMESNEYRNAVRQAQREAERNVEELSKDSGDAGRYGQVIQLQHVATGKFLTTSSTSARVDRDCLALALGDGSAASYFKVQPRYKVRAEGGQILINDEVLLCSCAHMGFYVHQSLVGNNQFQISRGGFYFNEANVGSTVHNSVITISLYGQKLTENSKYLYTGQSIRFLDRESESFLQASCSPEFEGSNHIIEIPNDGDEISVTSGLHFSSKSMWCIEQVDREIGGVVEWNTQNYRIRHIPSKKYVTMSESGVWVLETGDGVLQSKVRVDGSGAELCYDLYLEEDTSDEALQSRQTFQIKYVHEPQAYVPKSDCLVVLAHRLPSGTFLYMHSTKLTDSDQRVRMTPQLHTYDALMLTEVSPEHENIVYFLTNAVEFIRSYSKRIQEKTTLEILQGLRTIDLTVETAILRKLIFGALRVTGTSATDALTLDGPLSVDFQNCARDQLLLDVLLDVVVAPVLVNIDMVYDDKNPRKTLEWRDRRFQKIVLQHQLAWRALKMLVSCNAESQAYFVTIVTLCKKTTAASREEAFAAFKEIQNEMESNEDSLFVTESTDNVIEQVMEAVPDIIVPVFDSSATAAAILSAGSSQKGPLRRRLEVQTYRQQANLSATATEVLAGYFFKEGSFIRSWKRRYFQVFSDGNLTYKENKDSNSLKGSFSMSGIIDCQLFNSAAVLSAATSGQGVNISTQRAGGNMRMIFESQQDFKNFAVAVMKVNQSNNLLMLLAQTAWIGELRDIVTQQSAPQQNEQYMDEEMEGLLEAGISKLPSINTNMGVVGIPSMPSGMPSPSDLSSLAAGSRASILRRGDIPSSADIIHTGFLHKQGSFIRNWRRRYFELRADGTMHYKEGKDAAKEKGTFDTSGELQCQVFNAASAISIANAQGLTLLTRRKGGSMKLAFETVNDLKAFLCALLRVNCTNNVLLMFERSDFIDELRVANSLPFLGVAGTDSGAGAGAQLAGALTNAMGSDNPAASLASSATGLSSDTISNIGSLGKSLLSGQNVTGGLVNMASSATGISAGTFNNALSAGSSVTNIATSLASGGAPSMSDLMKAGKSIGALAGVGGDGGGGEGGNGGGGSSLLKLASSATGISSGSLGNAMTVGKSIGGMAGSLAQGQLPSMSDAMSAGNAMGSLLGSGMGSGGDSSNNTTGLDTSGMSLPGMSGMSMPGASAMPNMALPSLGAVGGMAKKTISKKSALLRGGAKALVSAVGNTTIGKTAAGAAQKIAHLARSMAGILQKDPALEIMTGLKVAISQIQFPVGAAEVMAAVLVDNYKLLTDFVDMDTINVFKQQIKDEGPGKQFMLFFKTICSCQGKGIRQNQDMCLENFVQSDKLLQISVECLPNDPSDGSEIDDVSKNSAGNKAYVTWPGDFLWKFGSKSLYFTPSALNLTSRDHKGVEYALLGDFCRPLSAVQYLQMKSDCAGDDVALTKLEQHLRVAEYFLTQLEMYCELLLGRAYASIFYVQNIFPYSMLVNSAADVSLPHIVRAAFVTLLDRLWVQRFPHEKNCGKQCLPDKIWVYTSLEDHALNDLDGLPHFVAPKETSASVNADPFFLTTDMSKFQQVTSFASGFFNEFKHQVLDNTHQNECISAVVTLISSLISLGFYPSADIIAVLERALPLLDGRGDVLAYTGDRKKKAEVIKPKFLLFGKNASASDEADDEVSNDDLARQRYNLSEKSRIVVRTKRNIINLLQIIDDFRHHFFVSKLLNIFKEQIEFNNRPRSFFTSCLPACCITKYNVVQAVQALFDQDNKSVNRLDLEKVCDIPLEGSLLDLMMYEDESLFEESYRLLFKEKDKLQTLFNHCKNVCLLKDDVVPEFANYFELEASVSSLRRLYEYADQWGISKPPKRIDKNNYNIVISILAKLRSFMCEDPVHDRQCMLLLLGAHKTLLMCLDWDLTITNNENCLIDIARESLELLCILVAANSESRKQMTSFGEIIARKVNLAFTSDESVAVAFPKSLAPLLLALLQSIFKGSEEQVSKTPVVLFSLFAKWMPTNSMQALQFFREQLAPDQDDLTVVNQHNSHHHHHSHAKGLHAYHSHKSHKEVNITRNQVLTFKSLLAAIKSQADSSGTSFAHLTDISKVTSENQFDEHLNFLSILGLCFRKNAKVSFTSIEALVPWMSVARKLSKTLKSDAVVSLGDIGNAKTDGFVTKNKLKFLKVHLDLFSSVNLNAKAFDEIVVNDFVTRHLLNLVITSVRSQDLSTWPSTLQTLRPPEPALAPPPLARLDDYGELPQSDSLTVELNPLKKRMPKSKRFSIDDGFKIVVSDSALKEELLCSQLHFINAYLHIENGVDKELLETIKTACVGLLDQLKQSINPSTNTIYYSAAIAMRLLQKFSPTTVISLPALPVSVPDNSILAAPSSDYTIEFQAFVATVEQMVTAQVKSDGNSILCCFQRAEFLTDRCEPGFVAKEKRIDRELAARRGCCKQPCGKTLQQSDEDAETELRQEVRQNTVSWEQVIRRIIKHIDYKITNSLDQSFSLELLDILLKYLNDGKDLDRQTAGLELISLENVKGKELAKRQSEFSAFGVLELTYRIIAAHGSGDMFNRALVIANIMFEDGNRGCQDSFLSYAKSNDSEGKFFLHIQRALAQAIDWVNADRYDPNKVVEDDILQEEEDETEESEINSILLLLKNLCEGHNNDAQNFLRDQSACNKQSFNLIEAAVNLFGAIVPRSDLFKAISEIHCEVLMFVLEFLVSTVQGPCVENQALFQELHTFSPCRVIFATTRLDSISKDVLLNLTIHVVNLLAGCLEGRHNSDMERQITEVLENYYFDSAHRDMIVYLQKMQLDKSAGRALMCCGKPCCGPEREASDLDEFIHHHKFEIAPITEDKLVLAIRDLHSIRLRLTHNDESYDPYEYNEQHYTTDIKTRSLGLISKMELIEVFWNNEIEEVFFPVPNEAKFLSENTKTQFMNTCEISTADARVKALQDQSSRFIDEMIVFNKLSEVLPTFKWYLDNYANIKIVLFCFAILLNFHLLVTMVNGVGNINTYYDFGTTSAQILVVLGLALLAGYVLLAVYRLLPAVTMGFRNLRRLAEVDKTGKSYDLSVIAPFILTSWLFFGGCIIHYFDFRDSETMYNLIKTYLCIFVTLFVPGFLYTSRQMIVRPRGSYQFAVSFVIDVMTDSQLMQHMFFIGAVLSGLIYKYVFFSLMLVEFVTLSENAYNVILSVTKPWKSLWNLVVVFLIALVIYAMFGYAMFGGDEFADGTGCDSLLSCVGLVIYGGVRSSDVASVMNSSFPGEKLWTARFFFDILFFITIGALLFNMVTGIIVDTFASLREDTQARETTLSSETFVSGLTREALESTVGLDFDELQDRRQNVWSYVHYILYLRNTPPTEMTGLESYVWNCIQSGTTDWFPFKTCKALSHAQQKQKQLMMLSEGESGEGVGRREDSETGMSELRELMKTCMKSLEEIKNTLAEQATAAASAGGR